MDGVKIGGIGSFKEEKGYVRSGTNLFKELRLMCEDWRRSLRSDGKYLRNKEVFMRKNGVCRG